MAFCRRHDRHQFSRFAANAARQNDVVASVALGELWVLRFGGHGRRSFVDAGEPYYHGLFPPIH